MTPFRRVPPTLAPVSWNAIWSGLRAVVWPGISDGQLELALGRLFEPTAVAAFSSGRAALAEGLAITMRVTGRRHVVLPAFTSFSVAAAAAAAGARVDLCDLDPLTMDLDRASLRECVHDRTAAVVLGNLFGFPNRTNDLGWLRDRGVMIIDDAAQSLGATEEGALVGSRGALGVLSFGRGKCVMLGQGGALLANDPALARFVMPPAGQLRGRGLWPWVLAVLTTASANQYVFGGLSRVPGARIGESHFDTSFTVGPVPSSVDAMAVGLADAVARLLQARRAVAAMWRGEFGDNSALHVLTEQPGVRPAYLRVPVMAASKDLRREAAARLVKAGFPYVRSFPTTLRGIDSFYRDHCVARDIPGAQQIAERLLALPCHSAVRRRDIDRARNVLRGLSAAPDRARVTADSAVAGRG